MELVEAGYDGKCVSIILDISRGSDCFNHKFHDHKCMHKDSKSDRSKQNDLLLHSPNLVNQLFFNWGKPEQAPHWSVVDVVVVWASCVR